MTNAIKLFEHQQIRAEWDVKHQKWYFAIVDVIAVLTGSVDPGAYWRKLKKRLKKEGNETVTSCHGLKMTAADGKRGGRVAGTARRETEKELGRSIVSKQNFLPKELVEDTEMNP